MDLFAAVAARHLAGLDQPGAEPRDLLQRTPLMCACLLRPPAPEVVARLIAGGADLAAQDEHGASVLAHALSVGEPALIEQLLAAGAPVHQTSQQGHTLLHYAARTAPIEVLTRLLDLGLEVNAANQFGITPLMEAVAWRAANRAAIIRLLAARGAHLDAQRFDGFSALILAADGERELLEVLLELGASPAPTDRTGRNALAFAAASPAESAAKVERLLRAGAAPASAGPALHAAAKCGHAEAAQHLLQAGTPVDVPDEQGFTPLMTALIHHQTVLARLLLAAGAEVRARSHDSWQAGGQSVLGCALGGMDDLIFERGGPPPVPLALAEELLRRGAAVDAEDTQGETALFRAVGHPERLALLLQWKAEVNHRSKMGRTPLMAAAGGGHAQAVLTLLNRGARVNDTDQNGANALWQAVAAGNLAVVRILLQAEGDARVTLASGVTLLMQLSWGSWSEDERATVAKLLLAHGAALEARGGEYDRTALMYAAFSGKGKLVKFLLAQGADREARDNTGKSAAELAEGSPKVRALFKAQGKREPCQ